MKICILVGSLSGGGAERVASILANKLFENKNDVFLINFEKKDNEYYINEKISRTFIEHKSVFYDIWNLNRTIKKIDADIYISIDVYFNILIGLCKKINNIKVIMSERNDPQNVNISIPTKILRNICYKFSDAMVFQTKEAMEYFGTEISKKSVVIPNPIKSSLPRRVNNPENIIVAVGRLSKQKNYPLLLEVFSQIIAIRPTYKLVIYGEGEERENILQYILALNIEKKVELRNFSDDLHNQIKQYEIYVMTSNYEGIPNSLLEAMGMGFPVISSDTPSGGPKTLIKHGYNGLLFKPGDKKELYSLLLKIIDDKKLQNYFSNNALEVNKIYAEEVIAEKWINTIERLVK